MTADLAGLHGRPVPLPGAAVHVYEGGRADGPPLLVVHGFLTSAFTWRHVAPALGAEHRLLLVDLPGSGLAPDPPPGPWPATRCAGLLAELLDALELPEVTLVGSQMGGSLAAWFAAEHRERVSRLVVMAAGVLGEAQRNLTLYRALANPLAGPRLARLFPRRAFERRWRAAHGPAHEPEPAATARYFEQLRARGHAMARLGLDVRLSYGSSFDRLAGSLRGVAVPTLLIFGGADTLVPPSTGRRFQELLPDAHLVTIPGCGDFPQEEHPAVVAGEILRFTSGER